MNLKPIYITGILLAFAMAGINAQAQTNIVRAEYFINEDPGFGLAIPINIGAGTTPTFDVNFSAATDTLSSGYHFIYIRAQDELGVWSYLEGRSFYVVEPSVITPPVTPKIIGIEYFINEDPGQGLAIYLDVTDNYTVDIPSLIAQTDTLSAGYHIIGTRAKTANGNWGWYERRSFYVTTTGAIVVPPVQKIVDVEYYFDVDPGQGQATSLGPYSPNLTFDLNELIPTSLTAGYHTFNIRSKAENGHWGFVEQRPVYVITAGAITSITDINKIEYFIDGNDPGFGNATNLPITPGQVIDLNPVKIPTSPTLIDGQHTLHFRARNGNGWGLTEIDTFDILDDCTQPIASFTTQLNCAGSAVVFNNTTDSLQADATYRWYLDGDAIVDDTTQNTSFTYPFPGTYVVALAVRQGTICLDSAATTIEIKPQPAAAISFSGGGVNQVTNFYSSGTNLPAGATWSWDFDGDLVADDTTSGNTSFIYTAEGTYNASLTIGDSLGCSVTATTTVNISGSGTNPPFVDFLANNGCAGSSISFIDLSQNLPLGSTYSWDFDGDGSADSNTAGTSSFTYPTSGSYNAQLTVDVGGSTLSATHTIEIVDVPVADFSAIEVCEGLATVFTDLSTPGSGNINYRWDFNNDGTVDSNAKTGISYTFPSSGSFIVKLTIDNGYGCQTEVVRQVNVIRKAIPNFDWGTVCTGETVRFNDLSLETLNGASYSWDFDGDGSADSNASGDASFIYPAPGSYNASLTINNIAGCSANIIKPVEVFDRPEVILQVNAQCYGQESQMIDISQNVDPNATYRWDFQSDGIDDDFTVGSTGFTYDSYSSYLVTLNIDNGGGCVASAQELVEFADAASPDFSTNKLCEGEEVVFTNLSTSVNPVAIYSWDFDGDGLEDSAYPGSSAYTYLQAGIYDATLTIDNGGNCLAYKTIPLEITPPPAVDLGPDMNLCIAGTVTLDAGVGYSAYLWPDGSTNQTYTIDQVGSYTVRVQDAKQCFNTDTLTVSLLGAPAPSFTFNFDLSYQGIRVAFENTSTNADSYEWDFGDGTTTDEIDPSYVFGEYSFYKTSVYNVCLTAFNECDQTQFCEEIFVSPTEFIEEAGNQIRAYPVPTRQDVKIKLKSGLSYRKAALMNPLGEVLWLRINPEEQMELDLGEYSSGIYYFVVATDNKYLYKKLLKR